jgi:hypothetical protein
MLHTVDELQWRIQSKRNYRLQTALAWQLDATGVDSGLTLVFLLLCTQGNLPNLRLSSQTRSGGKRGVEATFSLRSTSSPRRQHPSPLRCNTCLLVEKKRLNLGCVIVLKLQSHAAAFQKIKAEVGTLLATFSSLLPEIWNQNSYRTVPHVV